MINNPEQSKATVPIWEKMNLTIKEASEYSNIGINRLSKMVNNPIVHLSLVSDGKI